MKLLYLDAFLADVEAAVEWLEEAHPDWLPQFETELEEVEALLERHPDVGVRIETAGRVARKFFFRRAPYVVWYDRPEPGVVRLLRVFHGHARRPREKKIRRRSKSIGFQPSSR